MVSAGAREAINIKRKFLMARGLAQVAPAIGALAGKFEILNRFAQIAAPAVMMSQLVQMVVQLRGEREL
jgi:hypothetical protein